MNSEKPGIKLIRDVVSYFNGEPEWFNERYTPSQLIALYNAAQRCDWDIPPSVWDQRQIDEALVGVVPDFEEVWYGYAAKYGDVVDVGECDEG